MILHVISKEDAVLKHLFVLYKCSACQFINMRFYKIYFSIDIYWWNV